MLQCFQTKLTLIVDYTYLAGCTDPKYEHPTCPNKGNYSEYQWVGLVSCGATGKWVGCPNDKNPTVRKSEQSENCTCSLGGSDGDVPLFTAADLNGLVAKGTLPANTGEAISFVGGWTPTGTAPVSPISTTDTETTHVSELL